MADLCERCHEWADVLIAVETVKATFWSPAENMLVCEACIQQEQDHAGEIEERRAERRAERRREERLGL